MSDPLRGVWAAEITRLTSLAARLCQAEQSTGQPHLGCVQCETVRPVTALLAGCPDCGSRSGLGLEPR